MKQMSKDEDFDPVARRMNFWLYDEIGKDKDILKTDTKHVIKDEAFKMAVNNARSAIGLADYYPQTENESNITTWLINRMAGKQVKYWSEAYQKYDKKLYEIITRADSEANLQYGWYEYMEAFIALGKKPKTIKPIQIQKMYVEGVSEDRNSLIVRMDKGLSAEDYRKAWNRLKRFLNKPSTAPVYAEVLKNKIYLDRQNGMTFGELAQKYYPREYAKDQLDKTDNARDKVKKIVARFKRPY